LFVVDIVYMDPQTPQAYTKPRYFCTHFYCCFFSLAHLPDLPSQSSLPPPITMCSARQVPTRFFFIGPVWIGFKFCIFLIGRVKRHMF
jgi:hypothetical protein